MYMDFSFISNYMNIAISEAKKGYGYVNPNPLVGAVIVKDNKIISTGYHKKYGDKHAEVNAIENAVNEYGSDEILKGASIFVTLEPCCHKGKQPPCTDAIIKSGITEVYVGSSDPNPLVNGGGIKILEEHNIKVHQNILKKECDELNPVFFHFVKHHTPYITLKYAMSLNGKSIIKNGNKRISCDESIKAVHQLRSGTSAVLVSSNTVNDDDCILTARNIENCHQPVRVILDKKLKINLSKKILYSGEVSNILILYNSGNYFKVKKLKTLSNVELIKIPLKENHLDLEEVLKELGKRNMDSVLVESSGELSQAFVKNNLYNKIQIYIGSNFISEKSRTEFENAPEVKISGKDILLEYERNGLCLQD